jgi:hypothetical protein
MAKTNSLNLQKRKQRNMSEPYEFVIESGAFIEIKVEEKI